MSERQDRLHQALQAHEAAMERLKQERDRQATEYRRSVEAFRRAIDEFVAAFEELQEEFAEAGQSLGLTRVRNDDMSYTWEVKATRPGLDPYETTLSAVLDITNRLSWSIGHGQLHTEEILGPQTTAEGVCEFILTDYIANLEGVER